MVGILPRRRGETRPGSFSSLVSALEVDAPVSPVQNFEKNDFPSDTPVKLRSEVAILRIVAVEPFVHLIVVLFPSYLSCTANAPCWSVSPLENMLFMRPSESMYCENHVDFKYSYASWSLICSIAETRRLPLANGAMLKLEDLENIGSVVEMKVARPDRDIGDGELYFVFAFERAEAILYPVEFSYYIQRPVLPLVSRILEPDELGLELPYLF
jgi:hypothetical protein